MKFDDDNGYSPLTKDAWMEAQKLRQCALDRSPSVVSELANMCSSEYIKIAQKLAQVAEGNYNDVLGILNKATLPEGASS